MEYSKKDSIEFTIALMSEDVIKFCDSHNIVYYCSGGNKNTSPTPISELLHSSRPTEKQMLPLRGLIYDMELRHNLYHSAEYLTTTFDKIAVEEKHLCESEFILPLIVLDYYAEVISGGFPSYITVCLKSTNNGNNTNVSFTSSKKCSPCDSLYVAYVFNIICNQEKPEEYEKVLEMCKLFFCSKDKDNILLLRIKQSINTCIRNLLKIDSKKFNFLTNYSQNQSFAPEEFALLLRFLDLKSSSSFDDHLYKLHINASICYIFDIRSAQDINLVDLSNNLKTNYSQYTAIRKYIIEIQKNITRIEALLSDVSDVLDTENAIFIDFDDIKKQLSTLMSEAVSSIQIASGKVNEMRQILNRDTYRYFEDKMGTLNKNDNKLRCLQGFYKAYLDKQSFETQFDKFLSIFNEHLSAIKLPKILAFSNFSHCCYKHHLPSSTIQETQIVQAQASAQSANAK